jgi:cell wall-associated NlpC family hydrolase
MLSSVGFLTSSQGERRHPRWMRRFALAFTSCGLLTLGGGYLALGAAGQDTPMPAAATATPSPLVAQQSDDAVSLPPLPTQSRARSVAPVAGAQGASTAAAADPGLSATDSKPTKQASGAIQGKNPASGGSNAVDKAVALGNGVALPPLEAPEAVKQIIEAGNGIARTPYKWGGGHGKWQDTGYDCSGSVSFVLAAAGLLGGPLASGPLMSWGEAGKGKWVTIYANNGHVFLEVAGIRFDTSAAKITGSRWINEMRPTTGFVARHPAGL